MPHHRHAHRLYLQPCPYQADDREQFTAEQVLIVSDDGVKNLAAKVRGWRSLRNGKILPKIRTVLNKMLSRDFVVPVRKDVSKIKTNLYIYR